MTIIWILVRIFCATNHSETKDLHTAVQDVRGQRPVGAVSLATWVSTSVLRRSVRRTVRQAVIRLTGVWHRAKVDAAFECVVSLGRHISKIKCYDPPPNCAIIRVKATTKAKTNNNISKSMSSAQHQELPPDVCKHEEPGERKMKNRHATPRVRGNFIPP